MTLRTLAGVLALCLLPSAAPTFAATDYSDLWWNSAESGWGAGIQRQGDVIFLTLFVYGADGTGTWFVAPDVTPQGSDASWSGTLYRTTGPGFATAFDADVRSTVVGTATLDFTGDNAGTLRYVVNGAVVTKQISRMTWGAPSPSGRYWGGFTTLIPQCADDTRIGAYDFLGNTVVTQSGSAVGIAITSDNAGVTSSCKFNGTSVQEGRYATIAGSFACSIVIGSDTRGEATQTTSRRGTFSLNRALYTQHGFHGELAARDQDCAFNGYMGGTRQP